jgi:hypothetical protein
LPLRARTRRGGDRRLLTAGRTYFVSTTTLSDHASSDAVVSEPASLLGSSPGDLVLRLSNGPHAGRIVRLSSAKCSIGSAADCTLRLRGAGLDPVHCVILRGSRQTVVRRWSDDTRLNDRRFDDMPLQHGDRLTLGSLEMQVMSVSGEVRDLAQSARRVDLELSAATSRLERLTERLDLANRQGRRRLRAVMARLRKYQLRLNEVESRRSRLVQEQEDLNAERARLRSAQDDVERRRGELEQEVRRLAESEGAATARRAELEKRATTLLEREAELTNRGRELTDRATTLVAEQARLQAAQAEFEQHRTAEDHETRRLAGVEAELTVRRKELDRRSVDLDAQQADLESREKVLNLRSAKLFDDELSLNERETALSKRIDDLRKQADDLTRRESEVAARCETLKNHWTVLTERETSLERDRAALAERERKLAEQPAPVAVAPTVVDPQAVERAEKLQAALNEARAELTALQAEQTRREAAWCEKQSADEMDVADRRAAVEAEAADLTARRATVELAARTVERWSALVEEWAAVEPTAVAPAPAAEPIENNAVNDEMVAALADAERHLLENQLDLEKLEAELKTWRDEARLWKSRFDEMSFVPTPKVEEVTEEPAAESAVADEIVADETAEVEARIESQLAAEPEVADEPVMEEPVAEEPVAEEAVMDEAPASPAEEVEPMEQPAPEAEHAEEEVVEETIAEAVPAHEVQQESAADVLRRLGLTSVLEEDAAPAAAAPQRIQPMPTPDPAPMTKPAAAETHHEGDESLDAYMKQLFNRLGVNQGKQPAPEVKPQPMQHAAPSHVEETSESAAAAPKPAPLPLLQPGEFKARSSAAERRSDLAALRELANFQAKTAIAKHQISRTSKNSKGKMTIGVLSLGMGLYCTYAYLIQGWDHAKYGMAAGAGIAALHMLQSLGLKCSAKRSARSLDDVIQKTSERGPTMEVGAK